jgi:DNA-binding transcriptional regulator of glucitol operon
MITAILIALTVAGLLLSVVVGWLVWDRYRMARRRAQLQRGLVDYWQFDDDDTEAARQIARLREEH